MTTSAELAAMAASASALSDTGSAMNGTLGQLRNDVEMTRSAWVGLAQIAFQKVMAEWDENSIKMNTALNEIGDMLAVNTKDYQAQEDDGTSAIGGLAGSGGLNIPSLA
ncbi:WXG100 family type VII secretion target [Tsukamurella sp. 8F]|uniref:WXG100 family type VII secretion target n=1 Tax=unclassified Tsukamurella TaxID=2633480 RepID=UPI0023BA0C72|nr:MULTISPECIES: WXG100 family type VII secretion target [unclassified Tsukamurella]MDF0531749.1 WXG100 family type VII secretion target [Tsukamurella sp. 8J]MDF0589537.1 WXG100 family type VII secretion target [Tsukamurella sp. 8F]